MSSILSALKFVQGAVARKDYTPELLHFVIKEGRIQGFNGVLGISCPIDIAINAKPRAVPMVKAIQACKAEVKLHLTPTGRLAITSGKFKVFIDCHQDETTELRLEGELVPLNGKLLGVLKKLAPFISEDASRPWSRGILLRGQSAFVTNNIILIEQWLGYTFPVEVNIPRVAIMELLRINEEPIAIQTTENCAIFHFEGDRWLRTQVVDGSYPDLSHILNVPANLVAVPPELFEAVETLTPFAEEMGHIYLGEGLTSTSKVEGTGATIEVDGVIHKGCFNNKHLLSLKDIVKMIDFSPYPKPCPFTGDKLRGVIVGMRGD